MPSSAAATTAELVSRLPEMASTAIHSSDCSEPKPAGPAARLPAARTPPATPAKKAEKENASTSRVVALAPNDARAIGESASA